MTAGLALVIFAAVLITAGYRNRSILDTVLGHEGEQESGHGTFNPSAGMPVLQTSLAAVTGTPKQIVDTVVLPLAQKHGIHVTAASVAAANRRHSPLTLSGRISDHKGPPAVRWAADMSNGGSPTPQMDALAADLARVFGLSWDGSGLVNGDYGEYEVQLIYRTLEGGNHFNHVHFGVHRR